MAFLHKQTALSLSHLLLTFFTTVQVREGYVPARNRDTNRDRPGVQTGRSARHVPGFFSSKGFVRVKVSNAKIPIIYLFILSGFCLAKSAHEVDALGRFLSGESVPKSGVRW